MKLVEDSQLIKKNQLILKSKLFFKADKYPKPLIVWPNGKTKYEVSYINKLNLWGCYMLNPNGTTRHWNAYGIGEPISDKNATIDLTISFPINSEDKQQGGAFFENEEGHTLLYHSGSAHGKSSKFWDEYKGDFIDHDSRKYAYVANLNSANCLSEIVTYIKLVKKIKRKK